MLKESFTNIMITTTVISFFISGAFGAFGAMMHYLFLVVKGTHQYKVENLVIYMFLGLFVGILADRLMLEFFGEIYHGAILLSGFLTIKILDFLDTNGLPILLKKAGVEDKTEDHE